LTYLTAMRNNLSDFSSHFAQLTTSFQAPPMVLDRWSLRAGIKMIINVTDQPVSVA